jgi:CRISPR-associated protein Csm3
MSELPPWPWSFERLHVRYHFTAQLETLTGIRIGAGKQSDAAATDQPVIRDALGRPFLPGSSLKGAMRSGLESVLRTIATRELDACDLFESPCFPNEREAGKKQEPKLEEILSRSCSACLLFGSSLIAGRVLVRDAALIEHEFFRTELRDGVGIDRELGTARPKIKYDTEVVPVGSFFELELRVDNVDELRLALVLLTIDLLDRGDIRLGGMTSRGLGRVAVRNPKLERLTGAQILLGDEPERPDWDEELLKAKAILRRHLQPGS